MAIAHRPCWPRTAASAGRDGGGLLRRSHSAGFNVASAATSPSSASGGLTTTGNGSCAGVSVSRLMAIAKDHETMCAKLMENARLVENQLRSLQAEHTELRAETQALRKCLDRSGVLPAQELAKELEHCSSEVAELTWNPTTRSSSSTAVSGPRQLCRNVSGAAVPYGRTSPRNASTSGDGEFAATHLVPGASQFSPGFGSPQRRGRLSSPSPTRTSPSPTRRSDFVTGSGAAQHQLGLRHRQRSRSPQPCDPRGKDGEDIEEASRSESSAVPTGPDLYDLVHRLLDKASTPAEQQRAFRLVQLALKASPDPPNSWSGPSTPLSTVVKAGRSDLARMFLRSRANPNDRDAKGVSPLHLATFDGNVELCRILLLAKADVDVCDRHGQTPLFFAPCREVCKMLIEKRADVNVLNRRGQSALHLAGRAGLTEVLSWLSSRVSKQLVDLRDVHGATAKHYSQQAGPAVSGGPRTDQRRGSSLQASEQLPSVSELVDEGPGTSAVAVIGRRGEDEGPAKCTASTSCKRGDRRSGHPFGIFAKGHHNTATEHTRMPDAGRVPEEPEGKADDSLSQSTTVLGFGQAKQFRMFDGDSLPGTPPTSASRDDDDAASPTEAEPIEELYDRAFGKAHAQAQAQEQITLLEAAAAVATAAVATAAELEGDKARVSGEVASARRSDERENAHEEPGQDEAEDSNSELAPEEKQEDGNEEEAIRDAQDDKTAWLDDLEESF